MPCQVCPELSSNPKTQSFVVLFRIKSQNQKEFFCSRVEQNRLYQSTPLRKISESFFFLGGGGGGSIFFNLIFSFCCCFAHFLGSQQKHPFRSAGKGGGGRERRGGDGKEPFLYLHTLGSVNMALWNLVIMVFIERKWHWRGELTWHIYVHLATLSHLASLSLCESWAYGDGQG